MGPASSLERQTAVSHASGRVRGYPGHFEQRDFGGGTIRSCESIDARILLGGHRRAACGGAGSGWIRNRGDAFEIFTSPSVSRSTQGAWRRVSDGHPIWLRSTRQQAILKIRHAIIKACRDFFATGILSCLTRLFSRERVRRNHHPFQTQYFERNAYLTQAGNCTEKRPPRPSERCTASARRFGPSNPRPAGI